MPNPRYHQEWVPPQPSPLANVHHTRPISQDPSMGLVRDPNFWKRFSKAVHLTEGVEMGEQAGDRKRSGSGSTNGSKNEWLVQQRRKKRKCRIICVLITLGVAVLLAAAIVMILFAKSWNETRHD